MPYRLGLLRTKRSTSIEPLTFCGHRAADCDSACWPKCIWKLYLRESFERGSWRRIGSVVDNEDVDLILSLRKSATPLFSIEAQSLRQVWTMAVFVTKICVALNYDGI